MTTSPHTLVLVGCGAAKCFDDEIEAHTEQLTEALNDQHNDLRDAFLNGDVPLNEFRETVETTVTDAGVDIDGVIEHAEAIQEYWTREVEAQNLYTSAYFDLKRRYSELHGDDWLIISAEHHVLKPDAKITTYEKSVTSMPKNERETWGAETTAQLQHRDWDTVDRVIVLLGKAYLGPIQQTLDALPVTVVYPFETTSGIGDQMGLLKSRIKAVKHNPDASPLPDDISNDHVTNTAASQQQLSNFE